EGGRRGARVRRHPLCARQRHRGSARRSSSRRERHGRRDAPPRGGNDQGDRDSSEARGHTRFGAPRAADPGRAHARGARRAWILSRRDRCAGLAEGKDRVMAITLGTGAYRYEVVDNWAKLPPGREFNADVAAVGVDKQDRVYAFNRGAHPMVVFDRDGNFLSSWGEGLFRRAHGVHTAPDDTLWLTDDGDHTVRHCTLEGKVLLTLGIPGKPKRYMSGEPFHR